MAIRRVIEKQTSSRGFTLVELLVVIAIIGLLVGLVVPAVQAARGAARRTQCAHRVRQIGLAIHHYESNFRWFPPGLTGSRGDYPFMTWLNRLSPYMEQQPLWEQAVIAFGNQPDPFESAEHIGFSTPIVSFQCPSDGRVTHAQPSTQLGLVALTSYVGVAGLNYTSRDGILFLDSRVRHADVTDGLSNTIVVGERPPSPDYNYGWLYAGFGQDGQGSPDMLLGVREVNIGWEGNEACPPGPFRFESGKLREQCDLFHFWSLHAGGANFAFADGSVRFLAYTHDSILPALATRSGGETSQIEP